MANDVLIVSASPQVYVRYTYSVNAQYGAANYSNITSNCWALIRNGSRNGTWDWNAQVSGSNGGSRAVNWGAGDYVMGSRTVDVGHDANGNLSIWIGAWIDAYYGSGTAGDTLGIPRIPLNPTILAITADTIKPTTARLGAEASNIGHGTSATWVMYYRLQGAGGWTNAGSQADVGGYNYWNLTGLKPGKTYEYYTTCTNNNGDNVASGTQTFKTKGVAGMVPVLMGIIG